jgi:hypothetical protein
MLAELAGELAAGAWLIPAAVALFAAVLVELFAAAVVRFAVAAGVLGLALDPPER